MMSVEFVTEIIQHVEVVQMIQLVTMTLLQLLMMGHVPRMICVVFVEEMILLVAVV